MFINNLINDLSDFEFDICLELNQHPSNIEEYIVIWNNDFRKFLTRRYKFEYLWEMFELLS